jgi:hypothetical protein
MYVANEGIQGNRPADHDLSRAELRQMIGKGKYAFKSQSLNLCREQATGDAGSTGGSLKTARQKGRGGVME